MTPILVFTIGHSRHPIDELVHILINNDSQRLVDIRTVPGSRHNPQFGEKEMEKSMPKAGTDYGRLKELGGPRHTPVAEATVNGAWRNKSFRDYADYMQTPAFTLRVLKNSSHWRRNRRSPSCAQKPFRGAAIGRLSAMRCWRVTSQGRTS